MALIRPDIQALYDAFAKYPLGKKIDGCPHCELGPYEAALHQKALRDLTWDDLGVYSFKAMTTFGGVDDFKHFLPRILELYVNEYYSAHCGFEVFLRKLEYGRWGRWPVDERLAVWSCIKSWVLSLSKLERESEHEMSIYEEILEDLEVCGLRSAV